jgi:phage-related protein
MAEERSVVYSVKLDSSDANSKLSALSSAFERLSTRLGSPISMATTETAFTKMSEGVSAVSGQVSMLDTAFANMAQAGEAAASNVASAIEGVGESAGAVAEQISMFDAAFANMAQAGEGAASNVTSAMEGVSESANVVVEQISMFDTAFASMMQTGEAAANNVTSAMGSIGEEVNKSSSLFDKFGDVASKVMSGISTAANKTMSGISTAASKTMSVMSTIAGKGISAFEAVKRGYDKYHNTIVSGATKIKNALLHPVETIKQKFLPGLNDSQKATAGIGQEANNARTPFDMLAEAGDRIKFALKNAAAMLIGFRGIKSILGNIKGLFSDGLSAVQEAEQIEAKFQTLIDANPQLVTLANNWAEQTGTPIAQVKELIVGNVDFFNKLGASAADAGVLGGNLTTVSDNIAKAFGAPVGDVNTQVQAFIAGDEKALTAYGIILDQSTIDDKAKELFNTTYEHLSESDKALVMSNLLTALTAGVSGTAISKATTLSETLTTAQGKFTNAMTNLKTAVGDELKPALMGYYDEMAKATEEVTPKIAGIGTAAGEVLTQLTPALSGALVSFTDTFAEPLTAALESLAGPMATIVGFVSDTVFPTLGSLVEDAAKIVESIKPDEETMAGILAPFNAVRKALFGDVESGEEGLIKYISGAIVDVSTKIVNPVTEALGAIGANLETPLNTAYGTIKGIVDQVKKPIEDAVLKLAGLVIQAAPFLEKLSPAITFIGGLAGDVFTGTIASVGKIIEDAQPVIEKIMGLATDPEGLIAKLGGIFSLITDGLFGKDDQEGLLSTITTAVSEISTNVIEPLSKSISEVIEAFNEPISAAFEVAGSVIENLKPTIETAILNVSTMLSAIAPLIEEMAPAVSAVGAIIGGIIEGALSLIGDAALVIADAAMWVKDPLHYGENVAERNKEYQIKHGVTYDRYMSMSASGRRENDEKWAYRQNQTEEIFKEYNPTVELKKDAGGNITNTEYLAFMDRISGEMDRFNIYFEHPEYFEKTGYTEEYMQGLVDDIIREGALAQAIFGENSVVSRNPEFDNAWNDFATQDPYGAQDQDINAFKSFLAVNYDTYGDLVKLDEETGKLVYAFEEGIASFAKMAGIGDSAVDLTTGMDDVTDSAVDMATATDATVPAVNNLAKSAENAADILSSKILLGELQKREGSSSGFGGGFASGTDDFAGGWLRMNEEGGELAYLPQGTAIVPSDKTDRILEGGGGDYNTTINITVQGSVDDNTLTRVRDELEDMMRKVYNEMQARSTTRRSLVHAYA